jgi:hypothetical protein
MQAISRNWKKNNQTKKMETKSFYKWLYGVGGTVIVLLVMVIAIAAQSQDKRVVKKPISAISATDSILPDTTRAKVNLVLSMATLAEKAVQQDSLDLVKETVETQAMRKNSAALESLVKQKENEPIRPKSAQFTTNVIKYPDTLTIVIKSEKKGIFKSRRE